MSSEVGPREILGVRVLPPARATAASERLRARLAALHRAMAPPPIRVLEGVFGLLDHVALSALCHLDIPDLLGKGQTVDDLAAAAGTEREVVERVTRYAAGRGWLRIDRRGQVRPNRTTKFLRRDHPGGWRAWVEFASGPEVMAAAGRLAVDPSTPDPFASANGASFFDWYPAHPDRHAAFDAAMAAGGRMHGLVLADALDWSDVRRVCDVGGGTGALLRVLLNRQPHLDGVLFDLPAVAARAQRHGRLEIVGGDAFAGLPEGCDTYLFVNVVHDWDDDATVRLLRGVPADARAIVVEGERRARPVEGIALRTDLLMLALAPGGRERTTAEIGALAIEAGRELTDTVALASGDRAHVLTARPTT
jgi:hypothetical protein